MKKSHIIILFVFLFTLTGCRPMLSLFFGISKPKPKSAATIERRIDRYDLHYFKHYSVTQTGFKHYFNTLLNLNIKTSVTRVLIFKDNKLLRPSEIAIAKDACSSERSEFIKNLQDSTYYISMDSVLLSDFVNSDNLQDFDVDKFEQENSKEFTVIIYWATFAGVLNRNSSRELAKTARDCIENNGLSAHVFYVNLDKKKDWD